MVSQAQSEDAKIAGITIEGVPMNDTNSEKILIVDDVPANLKMLSDLLEPEGYYVLLAPNREIALKVATRMYALSNILVG